MSNLVLPVTPGVIPQGVCPSTLNGLNQAFCAVNTVVFPSTFSGVLVQPTKPSDTTKVWLQQDSLGRPTRFYIFAQGAWLSAHPLFPGFCTWYFSPLPNFATFDGGDGNSLSPISGPMWQQAVDQNSVAIAAKFVVSAGTLPSGTVLPVPGSGGNETVQLVQANLPKITQPLDNASAKVTEIGQNYGTGAPGSGNFPGVTLNNAAGSGNLVGNAVTTTFGGNPADPAGAALGHPTLPVYVVGYLLQRTTRLYYAA